MPLFNFKKKKAKSKSARFYTKDLKARTKKTKGALYSQPKKRKMRYGGKIRKYGKGGKVTTSKMSTFMKAKKHCPK